MGQSVASVKYGAECGSLSDLAPNDVIKLAKLVEGDGFELSVPRRESVGCLALMKPGALLINVARARIVGEGARSTPLKDGHPGGAALDVWWHYPT